MKMFAYAVFDSAAGVHSTPWFAVNDRVAQRAFVGLVRDGKSDISLTPTDFSLVRVGVWDDAEGGLSSDYQLVMRGADAVQVREVV